MAFRRIAQFLIAACMLIIYLLLTHFRKTRIPYIKRQPALDAIDEAIGRCVELDRPININPGTASILGGGLGVIAGLNVLNYTVKRAAKLGAKFFVLVMQPEVFPLIQGIVREALNSEGQELALDHVRFISQTPGAFQVGSLAQIVREKVGANIVIGSFEGWSLPMMIAGNIVGAVNIGGEPGLASTMVVTCDYYLMADEVYAMGAYLSKDKVEILGIKTCDISKMVCMAFIILGIIFAIFNNRLLLDWLSI